MEIRRLNTLRGLAALIVLVSHFSNANGAWGQILGLGAGQIGVMLFFVLSGFLMSFLYWPKQPDHKTIISFVVARVARVVPLYLFVVIVSYLSGWPYNINNTGTFLSHLLFLHGTSVLWTIPVENQFYALFALAWIMFRNRPAPLVAIVSVYFVFAFFSTFSGLPIKIFGLSVDTSILRALPYFIFGSLFGLLYRKTEGALPLAHNGFTLGLLLILFLYPGIYHHFAGHYYRLWNDTGALLVLVMSFASIVFFVPSGNILMENVIGDFLGKISYSLYLLHLPLLRIFMDLNLDLHPVILLLVFLATSVLVAFVSYLTIEYPFRRIIRSVASPRGGTDGVVQSRASL